MPGNQGRLYFLSARRVPPVPSPILVEASEILRGRGFQVESMIAEEHLLGSDELDPGAGLYLLKSHTQLSLSIAGTLHARGARLLNPYPSCAVAQNKILAQQRLEAWGIPVPRTWVTGDLSLLRLLLAEGPLIIKPHLGHRGAGITIVATPEELEQLPPPSTTVIVQEFVPGPGEDLKVYVVGDEVFAVRKPFSETSFSRPGIPCPVTERVREIALACGRAFGLGLYGIDIIEGPSGPRVVDLNTFPGYKGVPEAAAHIADYLERYANGEVQLSLPELAPPVLEHSGNFSLEEL